MPFLDLAPTSPVVDCLGTMESTTPAPLVVSLGLLLCAIESKPAEAASSWALLATPPTKGNGFDATETAAAAAAVAKDKEVKDNDRRVSDDDEDEDEDELAVRENGGGNSSSSWEARGEVGRLTRAVPADDSTGAEFIFCTLFSSAACTSSQPNHVRNAAAAAIATRLFLLRLSRDMRLCTQTFGSS